MNTRLTWIPLAALMLLAAPAYADDPSEAAPPKKAEAANEARILSLNYQDAPVTEVLMKIAQYAGVNLIVNPDVKGTVSVRFTDIGWKDALAIVAQSKGLKVTHRPHGITLVSKAPGPLPVVRRDLRGIKLDSIDLRTKDMRAKQAEAAAAAQALARQRAAIDEALQRSAKRVAELERELTKAKKDGRGWEVVRLETELEKQAKESERRKLLRSKKELVTTARGLFEVKHKGSTAASQMVQLYDVGDLDLRRAYLQRTLVALRREGATIEDKKKGLLVVRAPHVLHVKLAEALTNARATAVDPEFRALSALGVLLDAKGKPVKGGVIVGRYSESAKIKAAQDRLNNLRQALDHLEKANAKNEVRRVSREVRVAEAQLNELRAKVAALAKARAEESARVAESALKARQAGAVWLAGRGRPGQPGKNGRGGAGGRGGRGGTAGGPDGAGGGSALQALHKEVRALRGDVKELTALVRQLLARERR